jgi:hypothetical protein
VGSSPHLDPTGFKQRGIEIQLETGEGAGAGTLRPLQTLWGGVGAIV